MEGTIAQGSGARDVSPHGRGTAGRWLAWGAGVFSCHTTKYLLFYRKMKTYIVKYKVTPGTDVAAKRSWRCQLPPLNVDTPFLPDVVHWTCCLASLAQTTVQAPIYPELSISKVSQRYKQSL